MTSLKLAAALCVLSLVAGLSVAQDDDLFDPLKKYGCTEEKKNACIFFNGNIPVCDRLQRFVQCIFRECPGIKGTLDVETSVKLVGYSFKHILQCDIKVIDDDESFPEFIKDGLEYVLFKYGCTEAKKEECRVFFRKLPVCDAFKKFTDCLYECTDSKGPSDVLEDFKDVFKRPSTCDSTVSNLSDDDDGTLKYTKDSYETLFMKHGCTEAKIEECRVIFRKQPGCDGLQKFVQCTFQKCPGINGTKDAETAVKLEGFFFEHILQCGDPQTSATKQTGDRDEHHHSDEL